jgi:cytochrome b561
VGTIFYAIIGVHVLASFWHHFVRRDAVLRRML